MEFLNLRSLCAIDIFWTITLEIEAILLAQYVCNTI